MTIARLVMLSAVLALLPSLADAQGKPRPPDATLYFVWPQDGATIKGAFWCRSESTRLNSSHQHRSRMPSSA